MMDSHSNATFLENQYDVSTSKELLEKHIAELMRLANEYLIDNLADLAAYGNHVRQIKQSISKLYFFIENFIEIRADTPVVALYTEQNAFHAADTFYRAMGDIDAIWHLFPRGEIKNQIRVITYNMYKNHKNTEKHVCTLITRIMQELKVNEFELFQIMEADAIQTIKTHIEKNHYYHCYDGLNTFFDDLKKIPNLNILDDFGRKRLVFLWTALLKQEVDYTKIYHFGLTQIPPVLKYTTDNISEEEAKRIRQEEKERARIEKIATEYLLYLPLLAYDACQYDGMQETIRSLRAHKKYVHVDERVALFRILGDHMYEYDHFDQLKIKYGDGRPHDGNYNQEEDVAWLTAWRDKELALMSQYAASDPNLLDRINSLKGKHIKLKYLDTLVCVQGIGDIGDVILTLNDREFKQFAALKVSVGDFTIFLEKYPVANPHDPEQKPYVSQDMPCVIM